jgi:hypothetical protein
MHGLGAKAFDAYHSQMKPRMFEAPLSLTCNGYPPSCLGKNNGEGSHVLVFEEVGGLCPPDVALHLQDCHQTVVCSPQDNHGKPGDCRRPRR